MLAGHEAIAAAEAAERSDRAALDTSPEFERHRRYQSARHAGADPNAGDASENAEGGIRNGEWGSRKDGG